MQCEKVNMDNYRFYLPVRFGIIYSSGASVGPGDKDLDGCTSCDGDSDDDATFSF